MAKKTHDYTYHVWGHGISIWTPRNNGLSATAMGHGAGIKKGDYLIVANGQDTCRYEVEGIDYKLNPRDLWSAELRFSPRSAKQKECDAKSVTRRTAPAREQEDRQP